MLLRDGFQAVGEVRLVGGAGSAATCVPAGCSNGAPVADGGRGPALVLDRAQVQGSLCSSPASAPRVRCIFGAPASEATSMPPGPASTGWAMHCGSAGAGGRHADGTLAANATLVLDRSHIEGALVLRELRAPLVAASFAGTKAGTLSDDHTTWASTFGSTASSTAASTTTPRWDTRFRVDWLRRQSPAHLGAQFRTQPWRRLIRALQRQGGADDRPAASRCSASAGCATVARSDTDTAHPGALPPAPHMRPGCVGWLRTRALAAGRLGLAAAWLAGGAAYGAGAALGALDPASAPPLFDPMAHSLGRLLPVLQIEAATPWAASSPLGLRRAGAATSRPCLLACCCCCGSAQWPVGVTATP